MGYPLDTSHATNDPGIRHEGDHYSIHVNEKRSILDFLTTPTDTRDNTIDRTALFQEAANSVPTGPEPQMGAGIYVPAGQWKINSTVNMFKKGIRFYGDGTATTPGGFATGSVIIVAPGITGFSYDPGVATLSHDGPTFEKLMFQEVGAGASARTSTLVFVRNTNHGTFRDCSFRFANIGLDLPHTDPPNAGMDSAWHDLDNLKFFSCNKGLHMSGMGHGRALVFVDCLTWAMELEGIAAQGIYEGKIDGGGGGGIWCKGNNNHFHGFRCEGANPAFRIGGDNSQGFYGDRNTIIGGNITLNNTAHSAFQINAEAAGTVIAFVTPWGQVTSTNWIVDNGASTRVIGCGRNGNQDDFTISMPNIAGASPPGAYSGGGVLYVEGGALKYRGSAGTVTTIAPA